MGHSSTACEEMQVIVIVGGGISGLATALALHKKGLKSVVLEKSKTLRTTGAALAVLQNGWKALDQLGVASHLRTAALPLQGTRLIWINSCEKHYTSNLNSGEFWCLKRSDIVETLANALPPKTIRFGCDIVSVEIDPLTSLPRLLLSNGKCIGAKILIGCDGSRSIVANFLGLNSLKAFRNSQIRGLTTYPNGHSFPLEFVQFISGQTAVGILPITDKLVHWFIIIQQGIDTEVPKDPELIKQSALETISSEKYGVDVGEMIEGSDPNSLSFHHLRHRAPWDLMLPSFRGGTVVVAGDAMHVMSPYLGQGGSAGLEDAVVLARTLANTMKESDFDHEKVGEALDQYVKERRTRVVKLATQTYLTTILAENRPTLVKKIVIAVMTVFFRNPNAHTQYDCGLL